MRQPSFKICLIEDDEIIGEALSLRFELEDFQFKWFKTGETGLHALNTNIYHVVISDIRLPDISGEYIYNQLLNTKQKIPPFIIITAYGTVDQAVRLLKLGVVDYLIKPFEIDILLNKLTKLRSQTRNETENTLGVSPAMLAIEQLIHKVSKSNTTILISGESGVGKERVALKIVQLASNKAELQPFIAVNCAAFTESLLEAELFGYEKGAFTGANRCKKGVFEQADGGTLFLDEIGDMPLSMQAKILRTLQEKQFVRVGGEKTISFDCRIICSTHKDLKTLVNEGHFREDLYYRINVIHLKIPPLKDRKEDILWLAHKFIDEFAAANPNMKKILPPKSEQALLNHPWKGNVRELKHCLERACILCNSNMLTENHLFDDVSAVEADDNLLDISLSEYLANSEREYLLKCLNSMSWQIQETAKILGISRKGLWDKMRRLDIAKK